ncbi:phosphatidylinositol 4-phosphate 5-kinase 9-like [Lolium rigidum]|uniref:phosphatidylinositol 4-phosphate 5-kinase 9-like n=1 Tax=Lolium rigidum TaxID=89674 RepID=UPI001F5D3D18|nr:phosphatidylinositol 4-phosphate 5-kinase 9-like [Lolium rigidum]
MTSPVANDLQGRIDLPQPQENHSNAASRTNSAGPRVGELTLPNGDIYYGTLSREMQIPEGTGRYIWAGSSCVYEGEWRRGMRHGQGKTLWPSGATYEGEYSAGYMDGEGTYVSPDGASSYKGQWKLNRKHGLGLQTYPSGDMYQGSWVQGQMEGHGRYTWANGNSYVGTMRNGLMSGKGVLTWNTGESFQGNWLDGMMHGYGLYTWEDSGYYLGTWTRGFKDGSGTFYPKHCRVPTAHMLYIDDLRKRGVLPDISTILQESSSFNTKADADQESADASLPSRNLSFGRQPLKKPTLQRRWSIGVAIEKIIGRESGAGSETQEDMAGSDFPILERVYAQGVLISEVVLNKSSSDSSKKLKRRQSKMAKDIKRPGEAIIKGHRSYDLMLCLQLGIRYTVGKITPIQRREVRASDYGPNASFWMNFPKKGSRLTPAHRAVDFKWKDYCPMVFRNLREMFKIDTADYMMSICGSDALRELSSPGKSGSIFLLSQDDRFMIKTLRKSEVQVLLRMLPDYYRHVHTHENTLVTKFFGLHRVKPSSGQKFRFVVMGNMFYTALRIHRRFDLKGSSLGRSTDKIKIDENTTLKDLDLNYSFYLEPSWRDALLKQIETDSEFLKKQGIMDYSLLLGFHYRARQNLQRRASFHEGILADKLAVLSEEDAVEENSTYNYQEGLVLVQRGNDQKSKVDVGPHIRGSRLRSSSACFEEVDLLLPGTARLQIQLGVNMPARAEKEEKQEDGDKSFRRVYDVVLYIGIIDILQEYSMRKKIEHAYKSIKYNPLSISVVEPRFYSERFLKFIHTVFPQNSSN